MIKKTLLKYFLIFSILVGVTTSTKADEIIIVADEWAPYNNNPSSKEQGYGIEIAERVFEVAGHTVVYKTFPWSRAVEMTRKGKFNAIIGAYKEDAPDFVFPQEEFGISKLAFYGKKGSTWRYDGLDSLKTIRVGLIKDYSAGDKLDNFFAKNQNLVQYVHGLDPLKLNIGKVLVGRIDVLIEDTNVLGQKAKVMGVEDQLENVGNIDKGNPVYIAFSPKIEKSKEYAEILTKGIQDLKESGELDAILKKYGLEYWR